MRDGTWREMKVGVVRAEFKDGREQILAHYLCTLEDSSRFGKHWEALTLKYDSLKSVSRLKTYFGNHASRMDYGDYLRRHLCIGSGLAESSCKRVVSQRLKGSGMRWSVVGGEVIARLRGFFLDNELDAFFTFWSRRAFESATSPL